MPTIWMRLQCQTAEFPNQCRVVPSSGHFKATPNPSSGIPERISSGRLNRPYPPIYLSLCCLKEISPSEDQKILLHDLSTLRIHGIVTRVSQWGRADARVVRRDASPSLGECIRRTATGRVMVHHGWASLMKPYQPCRLATICDVCERKPWFTRSI